MNQSSAYIIIKDINYTYHFTGVISISHSMTLKIFEKADTTELGSYVNGAKNQPDKVTLSIIETDAAHSVQGWSARMLDVLASVKRERRLCQVVTPYRTYDDMLLSAISATQDETNADGWSGDISFTEYIPLAIVSEKKENDNSSSGQNTGSSAPSVSLVSLINKVTGSTIGSAFGSVVTAVLSLDKSGSLSRKLELAGIDSDNLRVIV